MYFQQQQQYNVARYPDNAKWVISKKKYELVDTQLGITFSSKDNSNKLERDFDL